MVMISRKKLLNALMSIAKDADKWITVRPNGANGEGRPALIDSESGTIKAGMGGKFNGRNIDDVPRGKNPHAVTEEKYQARQKRLESRNSNNKHTEPQSLSQKNNEQKKYDLPPLTKEQQAALKDQESPPKDGYLRTARPLEIKKTTSMAVETDQGWLPKSAVVISNGHVIQVKEWVANKDDIYIKLNKEDKERKENNDKVKREESAKNLEKSKSIKDKLTSIGGKYWEKGDKHRIYFNDTSDLAKEIGLEYETYKTGNISNATLNGERISNSDATKILYSLNDAYYDLDKNAWSFKGGFADIKAGELLRNYTKKIDSQTPNTSMKKQENTAAKTVREGDKWFTYTGNGEKREATPNEIKMMFFNARNKGMSVDSNIIIAFDKGTVRSTDENGYMHIKSSHITKATVNPYYGHEVPRWKELGLNPNKIYYGLRDPEELKNSLHTWSGLPLHIEHHVDSASDPQKLTRVGAVGTEVVWNDPYIDVPLILWDQDAIDGVENDTFRELSSAYWYDPDFTPGTFNGVKYDFVMRNIRGNHVALVEEGRAGHDVLVADSALKGAKNNPYREFIMKLSKLFKGAKDEAPSDIEQKEVDLAQAIIDLHKVNPITGEVMDVTEDDDKVAELKVLVGGLKDKLPPEDMQKLIEAVASLQTIKAEDEAENDKEVNPVENVHADAMKAAGCDAESPEETKAFAEGVKYGESLEKNPEERKRLDSEHESEGMKKAMDGCGVDGENPAEAKAFAEGVKYGEEKAKAEGEDEEPEDKPAAEDEDKNAMIEKIINAVPGLSEEQIAKMRDTLADLAYSPATGDEDIEEKVEAATDSALKKRRFLGATDAARIRAQATADAMKTMRSISDAVRRVRPLVGEMDAMSFDSASQVYGAALKQLGKNPQKYDRSAWRGMVDMLLDQHAAARAASIPLAADAKALPDNGPFSHLQDITLG